MPIPEGNYTIGRGKLLFKPDGQTNFSDLGNCPDFKFSVATEEKPHYSSRAGFQTKDGGANVKQTAAGTFTLDDLMNDNLKMFIMANAVTDVAQSASSTVDQAVTADLDKWLELGKRKLSNVVVSALTPDEWVTLTAYILTNFVEPTTPNGYRYECTTAGTSGATEPTWPTTIGGTVTDGTVTWTCRKLTYTNAVDYQLDTEVGLFMPLSNGAIAAAQSLLVDYDYAAITVKRIDAATKWQYKGHLYFVGNPPTGAIIDVKGYVSLAPNGDLSIIGDDWTNIGFKMEFESNEAYTGLYELITRGVVT